jgi:prevent-host-death family protein
MSSQTIGLFEAKTHLSEWVSRAERGEEVVITRHSKAVAKLVPMTPARQRGGNERQAAIAALLAFKPISVPDVSLKALIEAGRE